MTRRRRRKRSTHAQSGTLSNVIKDSVCESVSFLELSVYHEFHHKIRCRLTTVMNELEVFHLSLFVSFLNF